MTEIADRIRSLIPPELWEQYCHLSFTQMALVPELSEYAIELSEAQAEWHRASKVRDLKFVSSSDLN